MDDIVYCPPDVDCPCYARLVADNERLRAALQWYAEQTAGCRKLGSIGDPFRQALDADGGSRACAALTAQPAAQGGDK